MSVTQLIDEFNGATISNDSNDSNDDCKFI